MLEENDPFNENLVERRLNRKGELKELVNQEENEHMNVQELDDVNIAFL